MKRTLALCLLASALTSCLAPEPPPPEPREVHHYHTRTVYVAPARRAPAESAENFRAVEKPGSYSQ